MSIFDLFKKIESAPSRANGKPSWIVAGLGNPGKKYELTRHNMGFLALDTLAALRNARVQELRFKALCGRCELSVESVLLLKPQTFMNLSGEAISQAASFYKLPPERVLVICDDVSLPTGKLRIREKGSAGGHNGLKSIIQCLGTDAFPRIKIGVGSPPRRDYDMIDWVLGKQSEAEQKLAEDAVDRACAAAELLIKSGFSAAAAKFN